MNVINKCENTAVYVNGDMSPLRRCS